MVLIRDGFDVTGEGGGFSYLWGDFPPPPHHSWDRPAGGECRPGETKAMVLNEGGGERVYSLDTFFRMGLLLMIS